MKWKNKNVWDYGEGWVKWFAWYPVYDVMPVGWEIGDSSGGRLYTVWFGWVERYAILDAGSGDGVHFEYRFIKPKPKKI